MSDYVYEELIDEILIRLPSKSLLRFRSLSKLWCSRIGSPDFIHTHALGSPKNPQKFLIKHCRHSKRLGVENFYTLHSEDRLPLSHPHGYMGITPVSFPCNDCYTVGSCNGLVCLFDRKIRTITLWNPSIRRKLTLPHPPPLRNNPRVVFGFGFDPITYDYKIVGMSFHRPFERVTHESLIYTMNTGTWRVIASPSTTMFTYAMCACFVNGALHWIVTDLLNVSKNSYIISFDLSTEVFGKVLLPEPSWGPRDLSIIKGCLGLFTGERHNSRIWVRRKVNDIESWSVLFKLEAIPCVGRLCRVILLTNGDLVVSTTGEGYKVYNPETGVQSRLVRFKPRWNELEMETYTESLALLNTGIACNGNQPSWFRPRKRKRENKT